MSRDIVSTVRLVFIAVLSSCHLQTAESGFPNVDPTEGEPWPAPQQAHMNDTFFVVIPTEVRFRTVRHTCADLEGAIGRALATLRRLSPPPHTWSRPSSRPRRPSFQRSLPALLNEIEVWLDVNCDGLPLPTADMNEQYTIKINMPDSEGRAQIISNSLWGVYHGLETFTQLIYFSEKHGQFCLRHGIIRDFPRYSHRGLMIDTSRHFLHMDSIKATLDLMAFNKFNVLHWHIVDDPSFPFASVTFPKLSALGAFHRGLVYSPDDVADVIEYARRRGIRVMPEFDTPGHVRSWGQGVDGLLTECYNESTGHPDGTFGPLDPSKESTYAFVNKLLQEVTTRFPDKYIHLGGDEVSFGFLCWLSNPDIQAWMKKMNISNPEEIEKVYMQRLLSLVRRLPTRPEYVIWQDVIDNNITIDANTIVHIWKGGKNEWQEEAGKVTSLGHRIILSSCWYLNYINYGIDWPQYYECEPESFNGTKAQKALVVGGEACMWGEYVDDTNVISRTWPRASAVAERLWSSKTVNAAEKARSRMEEHRCRLLRRGYPVEPANGPGFC